MIPTSDQNLVRYLAPASTWATVTPVVLPGYDDPSHYRRRLQKGVSGEEQKRLLDCLNGRIETLICRAMVQAGYAEQLARNAVIDWRPTGFWPGVDLASRYQVPKHLKRFPRFHVRITWRDGKASRSVAWSNLPGGAAATTASDYSPRKIRDVGHCRRWPEVGLPIAL